MTVNHGERTAGGNVHRHRHTKSGENITEKPKGEILWKFFAVKFRYTILKPLFWIKTETSQKDTKKRKIKIKQK